MAEYETARDADGNEVLIEKRVVERRPAGTTYASDPVVQRRSGGGGFGILIALLIIAALVWAAFHFGLLGVSDKGSLPTVNVTTTGGSTPTITTGKIDVGSKKQEVDVPTVHVEKADGASSQ